MHVKYLGHSAFFISCADFSVCIDPFDGIGYPIAEVKADCALCTHSHFDHNAAGLISCKRAFVGDKLSDGELLIGGQIRAVKTFHDDKNGALRGENCVFVLNVGGITACHLGDIGEPFTPEICKKIGKIDVLFVPVGGKYTIDALGAAEYVRGLKPKIAVPMHYKTARSTIDISDKSRFLSMFGSVKSPAEFDINKENLPDGLIVLDIDDGKF